MTFGTIYLTAEAFRARYFHTPPGVQFSYATGDLAQACDWNEDARELRALIHEMENAEKIALTQRRRPDLVMRGGTAAFEYLATKRSGDDHG